MIEFTPFTEDILPNTWIWLNDPQIKALTNTPDFSKEDQNRWFAKLSTMDNYQIWAIKNNGTPIGACGLKNITTKDCEYWGYIGEKEYWGKGYGKLILSKMIDVAMGLDLSSIWLRVVPQNLRAIKLYLSKGFLIERKSVNEIIMRKEL